MMLNFFSINRTKHSQDFTVVQYIYIAFVTALLMKYIENFHDMKIMSRRNGGDLVNNVVGVANVGVNWRRC